MVDKWLEMMQLLLVGSLVLVVLRGEVVGVVGMLEVVLGGRLSSLQMLRLVMLTCRLPFLAFVERFLLLEMRLPAVSVEEQETQ